MERTPTTPTPPHGAPATTVERILALLLPAVLAALLATMGSFAAVHGPLKATALQVSLLVETVKDHERRLRVLEGRSVKNPPPWFHFDGEGEGQK